MRFSQPPKKNGLSDHEAMKVEETADNSTRVRKAESRQQSVNLAFGLLYALVGGAVGHAIYSSANLRPATVSKDLTEE